MVVLATLLLGDETWPMQQRSLRSIRAHHPDLPVVTYYALEKAGAILEELKGFHVEAIDIQERGFLRRIPAGGYASYNSALFNLKTAYKWCLIHDLLVKYKCPVIFVDADIKLLQPLPLRDLSCILDGYQCFVQDEGNTLFPKHPCTGFMGFAYSDQTLSLLEELLKAHAADLIYGKGRHDQDLFYSYLKDHADFQRQIYYLPQRLFPVGYMAPLYRNYRSENRSGQLSSPILFHANWVVGCDAKAALMDAFVAETHQQEFSASLEG